MIQTFNWYNKIINNKSLEPTKVGAGHMNNMHSLIIELIQKETLKSRT